MQAAFIALILVWWGTLYNLVTISHCNNLILWTEAVYSEATHFVDFIKLQISPILSFPGRKIIFSISYWQNIVTEMIDTLGNLSYI